MTQHPPQIEQQESAREWGTRIKIIVSGLIIVHLFAVVIAPLAGPPPSSRLARSAAGKLEWYIRPLFLGHGYRFFAPNPGPSHLVRYEIVDREGESHEGSFPSTDDQWPRLLYHRMFMLSETVNSLTSIADEQEFLLNLEEGRARANDLKRNGHVKQAERILGEIEADEKDFRGAMAQRDRLLVAIADQLRREHDAVSIKIYVQEHLIPTPLDVELGRPLSDPDLMQERLVYEWQEDRP